MPAKKGEKAAAPAESKGENTEKVEAKGAKKAPAKRSAKGAPVAKDAKKPKTAAAPAKDGKKDTTAQKPKSRKLKSACSEVSLKKVVRPGLRKKLEKSAKADDVNKAIQSKKLNLRGHGAVRVKKIRTTTVFRRPKTYRAPKNPQYPRKSIPHRNRLDHFAVLKHPLTTETAMKKIEDHNTLVFIVDIRASKRKILDSVKKMYDIKAVSVRTCITALAEKKAFVRLHHDNDALDVANRIGII